MRHSKLADRIEEVIAEPSKMDIRLKVGACGGWQRAAGGRLAVRLQNCAAGACRLRAAVQFVCDCPPRVHIMS